MSIAPEDSLEQSPWLEGIRGTQVIPIITSDAKTIRVEAGPGTGKTFGLKRRVLRIMHPNGLNAKGNSILIVAFNRVIAKQLRDEIGELLNNLPQEDLPTIETIHALCLKIIGTDLRLLLPHEREAMIYDVLDEYPKVREKHKTYSKTEQALKDHEAKNRDEILLWQCVERWRTRHQAQLISELPSLLLERIEGGDFPENTYQHVIVDEFQDLTPGEQRLVLHLRSDKGSFMALGDPRQSIYRFRGNEKDGLSKLTELLGAQNMPVTDVFMTECQRCPEEIVKAANQLMGLYDAVPMVPGNANKVNWYFIGWKSLEAEAKGMAENIVKNIQADPAERNKIKHLAMVTRRQFGYILRDAILELHPNLKIDLSFSEGLLETWAVREAFLFFCLIVDADAPTWRGWFSYQDPDMNDGFKAPSRNANAYLKFFNACNEVINEEKVRLLAERLKKPDGKGGSRIWQRAKRYVELRNQFHWNGEDAFSLLQEIFNVTRWNIFPKDQEETAINDMALILEKAAEICRFLEEKNVDVPALDILRAVALRLRYQIATSEPFLPEETADLQITTLWGAKGVTADHVYMLGIFDEAIPGSKREEYPGSNLDFVEEQRRLFYVSITRAKKTLVLSRPRSISQKQAKQLGIEIRIMKDWRVELQMCSFIRDIKAFLPNYQNGENWTGCV